MPNPTPLQLRLNATLADREARQLYRRRRLLDSPQSTEIVVDGKKLLNFCSNDYLGLANDSRLRAAFQRGVERWGVGAGASHLVCGHSRAHHELEEALAAFTGREAALLFSSGYAANLGAINGLVSLGDEVYQDRLNHASLLDGGWSSRAQSHWFAHGDVADLDRQLQQREQAQSSASAPATNNPMALVVSDGVFSMDGDSCPLADLVGTCQLHGAALMIDDAHGLGCLGEQGQGSVDAAHYSSADVPILMGTLGKAFGTSGAFIAGDKALIEYLVQKARTYIYTTAMPAAIAEASVVAVDIVRTENWRRDKLRELIGYFRHQANQRQLPLALSATAIQPVLVGDAGAALKLSRYLEAQGILVSAIRPPTVPDGTSRLRITITANHSRAQLDQLLEHLSEGSCLSND